VCDNVGDHLIGNVYARYEWETEAQTAVDNLNDRWYAGAFFFFFARLYLIDSPSLQAGRYTPNSLLLRISARLAADRMKTASATAVVSATLCICASRPRSSFLPCATASALSAGSIRQRTKSVEAAGNPRNARVAVDGALARDVVGVAMAKIGGRVNRLR
jgi:hypothetical protein